MLIIALTSFGAEYGKSITKIKNIDLSIALGLKYDSYDNGDDSVLTNLKGRVYYSLRLGMEKNNYLVELNYDVSNYEGDYSSSSLEYSDKARYGKTSIIFGYKFK